jgi:hypothetical protein
MKDTGVWREGAQVDNIVALAIGILSIHKDAAVEGLAVMANVLGDFEEIWLHMIAPVFETESQTLIRSIRGTITALGSASKPRNSQPWVWLMRTQN